MLPGTAQERALSETSSEADVEQVFKLTILSPGIGYEVPVGKFQTVFLHGYVGFNGGYSYSDAMGSSSYFYLEPTASVEYRYYYNFEKRQESGKRIAKNSANYLSPFFRTGIARRYWVNESGYVEHNGRAVHTVGAVWGLQRNYKSHFSLDLNIGAGYIFKEKPFTDMHGNTEENGGRFTIPGRLSIGFWLN